MLEAAAAFSIQFSSSAAAVAFTSFAATFRETNIAFPDFATLTV
jgi:hypothetical protein